MKPETWNILREVIEAEMKAVQRRQKDDMPMMLDGLHGLFSIAQNVVSLELQMQDLPLSAARIDPFGFHEEVLTPKKISKTKK